MRHRRTFLATVVLSALWPSLALGADKGKMWRIGFLGGADPTSYGPHVQNLLQGLRDLGYIEGKNFAIEYRWAEGRYERFHELINELMRSKVDLIVTHGTPGTRAVKQATQTIPIVMAIAGDALATGIVTNLARPGGNLTGLSFFNPELAAKRVEFAKEAMPGVTRMAVMINRDNQAAGPVLKAMRTTAAALKVELEQFSLRGPNEFADVFATMEKKALRVIFILEDGMLNANMATLVALAAKARMMSVGGREVTDAGGVLGYGVNIPESFRRAAHFVDRIIKGTPPGELPIEQPTRFELAINLKAAKAIGLTFPDTIVVRAERIIE